MLCTRTTDPGFIAGIITFVMVAFRTAWPAFAYSIEDDGEARRTYAYVLTYLVLGPMAILFLAPFAWLVSAAFQPMSEIFSSSPHWIPKNPTLAGFKGFLNVGHLTKAQQGQGDGQEAHGRSAGKVDARILAEFHRPGPPRAR